MKNQDITWPSASLSKLQELTEYLRIELIKEGENSR